MPEPAASNAITRIPTRGTPSSKSVRDIVVWEQWQNDMHDPNLDPRTRWRIFIQVIQKGLSYLKRRKRPELNDTGYGDWEEDEREIESIRSQLRRIRPPVARHPVWNPDIAADGEKEYKIRTGNEREASRFREGDLVSGSTLFLNQRNEEAFLESEMPLYDLYGRMLDLLAKHDIVHAGSQWSVDVTSYDRRSSQAEIDKMREHHSKRSPDSDEPDEGGGGASPDDGDDKDDDDNTGGADGEA